MKAYWLTEVEPELRGMLEVPLFIPKKIKHGGSIVL